MATTGTTTGTTTGNTTRNTTGNTSEPGPFTLKDIPYAALGFGVLAAEKTEQFSKELWDRIDTAVEPVAKRLKVQLPKQADVKAQAEAAIERWDHLVEPITKRLPVPVPTPSELRAFPSTVRNKAKVAARRAS